MGDNPSYISVGKKPGEYPMIQCGYFQLPFGIIPYTYIIILTFYYFTETDVRKSPSFEEYSTLSSYPTLKSSCSKIGIRYREFLEIKVVYNELRGSDLVSDEWINYLFIFYEQSSNDSLETDFRRIDAFQFQIHLEGVGEEKSHRIYVLSE